MAKKFKRSNPVLEKKYKEGYEAGYKKGMAYAKLQFAGFLTERFNGLSEVDGIGEKTFNKIKHHFGEKYFQEQNKKL